MNHPIFGVFVTTPYLSTIINTLSLLRSLVNNVPGFTINGLRSGLWLLITLTAHEPATPTKYDQFGV